MIRIEIETDGQPDFVKHPNRFLEDMLYFARNAILNGEGNPLRDSKGKIICKVVVE